MTSTKREMNRGYRQDLYVQRQKQRGMVLIKLWVPRSMAQKFKDAARKARNEIRALLD